MKPRIHIFMLMSLDGKISTGNSDKFDFDKDIPKLDIASGLSQYYDLELETELVTIGSGKTMQKMANQNPMPNKSIPVTCCVIDGQHINNKGLIYLSKKFDKVLFMTDNRDHIVVSKHDDFDNVDVYLYDKFTPNQLLDTFEDLGIKDATLQGGATLNASFIRSKCVYDIQVVMAPLIVGGNDVPTLVDGPSIKSLSELVTLKDPKINILKNGYLDIRYKIK